MGFVGWEEWFRSALVDESQRFPILVFLRLVGVNAAIYFLATVKARNKAIGNRWDSSAKTSEMHCWGRRHLRCC